jgi:hypothetical protein
VDADAVVGRLGLGEFGVDVDLDRTEEVHLLRVRRGDVAQELILNVAAAPAQRLDREPKVLCRPRDHGVGGQGETPRLLGLLLEVAGPDGALVGIQVAFENHLLSTG